MAQEARYQLESYTQRSYFLAQLEQNWHQKTFRLSVLSTSKVMKGFNFLSARGQTNT